MSIKHSYNYSVTSDAGSVTLTGVQTETGNSEVPINQNFAAGSSAVAISGLTFISSTFMGIFLLADKNCSVTFTGPSVTIALIAGSPFIWERSTGYFANPFASATVTGATLSCTPGVVLKGKILNA
jgi:hypothetical protein